MLARKWVLLPVFLLIAGCSPSGLAPDAEVQAERHMAIADTLNRAADLKKATAEYLFVAENFPSTRIYPRAVKNLGLLLGSASNPSANDSASRYWLHKYLTLTSPPDEKQVIQMYLSLADRFDLLRDSVTRQTALLDSLTSVTRKQAGEMTSRTHRLQELEAELQKVSTELQKLKEIDVRMSRSRGRTK